MGEPEPHDRPTTRAVGRGQRTVDRVGRAEPEVDPAPSSRPAPPAAEAPEPPASVAACTNVPPMILSDRTIREELDAGRIVIDPLDLTCIQPSSVDLHIDRYFRVFRNHTHGPHRREAEPRGSHRAGRDRRGGRVHAPPGRVRARLDPRAGGPADRPRGPPRGQVSLGRLGLLIHSTAGFVDAGWDGQLTLELSNVANLPITLYPGMKIGQISFIRMTTAADVPYGSAEVGSQVPGPARPPAQPLLGELHRHPRLRPSPKSVHVRRGAVVSARSAPRRSVSVPLMRSRRNSKSLLVRSRPAWRRARWRDRSRARSGTCHRARSSSSVGLDLLGGAGRADPAAGPGTPVAVRSISRSIARERGARARRSDRPGSGRPAHRPLPGARGSGRCPSPPAGPIVADHGSAVDRTKCTRPDRPRERSWLPRRCASAVQPSRLPRPRPAMVWWVR